jgi:hypothetical protein
MHVGAQQRQSKAERMIRIRSWFAGTAVAVILRWPVDMAAQDMPVIDSSRCRLVLPRPLTATIEQAAPDFQPWDMAHLAPEIRPDYRCTSRQAPYAVVGDFNGDARPDLTVEGHDRRGRVHLALLSTEKRWRLLEIYRWPLTAADSLSWHFFQHVAPGEIRAPEGLESPPLRLTTEAFEIVFWERASAVYVWRDSAFVPYVTGD